LSGTASAAGPLCGSLKTTPHVTKTITTLQSPLFFEQGNYFIMFQNIFIVYQLIFIIFAA
jgi:hypothetical protein